MFKIFATTDEFHEQFRLEVLIKDELIAYKRFLEVFKTFTYSQKVTVVLLKINRNLKEYEDGYSTTIECLKRG